MTELSPQMISEIDEAMKPAAETGTGLDRLYSLYELILLDMHENMTNRQKELDELLCQIEDKDNPVSVDQRLSEIEIRVSKKQAGLEEAA